MAELALPKILGLPPITNFDAYNKNTAEQYAALGRFVVAFEAMVNETRNCSINLLQTDAASSRLVDVAFHHPVLTAKPLFEIFRALIIEFLGLPDVGVPSKDLKIFQGVLKTIAAEYSDQLCGILCFMALGTSATTLMKTQIQRLSYCTSSSPPRVA